MIVKLENLRTEKLGNKDRKTRSGKQRRKNETIIWKGEEGRGRGEGFLPTVQNNDL